MSLIACPECNGTVSTKAPACPHCGSPVTNYGSDNPQAAGSIIEVPLNENPSPTKTTTVTVETTSEETPKKGNGIKAEVLTVVLLILVYFIIDAVFPDLKIFESFRYKGFRTPNEYQRYDTR